MHINSYDTSNHVVWICILGWRSQQKVSSEETHKAAETCLPDDFISLFCHPYWRSRILLNITPIEKFLLAEGMRGSYSISVSGLWHADQVIIAEIIIVKRLFQGRNSVTRVRIEPRSYNQDRRENDTAFLSATLPTF